MNLREIYRVDNFVSGIVVVVDIFIKNILVGIAFNTTVFMLGRNRRRRRFPTRPLVGLRVNWLNPT